MGIIIGTCVPDEPQAQENFISIRRVLYGSEYGTKIHLNSLHLALSTR
jgi:hypothetical protein